jgi:hypothetical protein
VIIWINGGFGAGKTTLAEELHRRLTGAVVYNPEDVGLMLWKWMRPNDDFQHQSAREWGPEPRGRGRRRRCTPADRDAPAALGQAHPGRTGRRGAGCG